MAAVAPASLSTILPSRGLARVKNVLSGDTVVLLGKAPTPKGKGPEVVFTLESINSPRMASKGNANTDEAGAFPAREWLRSLVIGKMVSFETRKQGASAGDRVYGLLSFCPAGSSEAINVAVEAVRNGHATPKYSPSSDSDNDGSEDSYKTNLLKAYEEAKQAKVGIHGQSPLVRKMKNSGDDFQMSNLVSSCKKAGKIKCVIEYIFDGSRFRAHVADPAVGDLQYSSFTLLLAGVSCPRPGNSKSDTPADEFSEEAKQFVELRLLQRELDIVLHGTDKSGTCGVATVFHPKGNIAEELLKNGLAKMSDWTVRMMDPKDVPALRLAENTAKRSNTGVWHSYTPPQLSGASQISGTVIEVVSGDTVSILPEGEVYDSEDKLVKVSLASVRAPRVGNERAGRANEPYCFECKDKLRLLTVGKACNVQVHYERDIPMGDKSDKRQYGTLSVKGKTDVAEVLISEGLATTQYHKEGDETSPRYDDLRAAESIAKASKKGLHASGPYKRSAVIDLTDPKKAKGYSESLMRGGKLKAVVEYCFNGSRFKMFVPSENANIIFAPSNIRCPQPSATSSRQTKAAEPFGDASKRHARMTVLQRNVEIDITGVTMGGVMTGNLLVGQAGQKRDYCFELVAAGLANVDQRKIDYGEAPPQLVDAQTAAQASRIGIWSVDRPAPADQASGSEAVKSEAASISISEIRSGSHFFYHIVGDESAKVIDDSMKLFTENNGTTAAPCDLKVKSVVAALFDDGSGKSWYRAKIVEKEGTEKATVLFIDHGNVATVPVATHLRPLDLSLGPDKIPAAAKEATLALTLTRSISDDYGLEAARTLQSMCWGKELTAQIHGNDENGKILVTITNDDGSVNEKLVSSGLARVPKPGTAKFIARNSADGSAVMKLYAELKKAQESARKSRSGMWRYGDIGDDDDEEI